jgi:hypothetical protein
MDQLFRAYPDTKTHPRQADRKRLRKQIFAENADAYGRARRARKKVKVEAKKAYIAGEQKAFGNDPAIGND